MFACGNSEHRVRDCSNFKNQDKDSGKVQASSSDVSWKNNLFYVVLSRCE